MFEVIHLYEPISRVEIASRLDLTSAAISNIVSDLIARGYVCQLGRRSTSRGQPSIELGIQADAAYTIGLHFEPRSVAGIVADMKGNVLDRQTIDLPPYPSPAMTIDALNSVGSALIKTSARKKILGVGLASVGPVDLLSGSVIRPEFTSDWDNVELREPLAKALGLPVFMDNDATAGAIGEYWYGAGRLCRHFLYVAFNNMGLGGGLILDGRVFRGSALNAAEFGHMIVQPAAVSPGMPPYLENVVSGHALRRDFGDAIISTLEQRLTDNDPDLEQWLDDASQCLAHALVSVDHLLDLDAIIVGGQLPAVFISNLVNRVKHRMSTLYMQGWSGQSTLHIGQIGQGSAVLGAAALPVYDAFSTTSRSVDGARNFLHSITAGALMH